VGIQETADTATENPSARPEATILVVEDEPDVLELVAFHLDHAGYRVIRAETGAQAQAEIQRSRPDVLILDLMLPDMSGLDILKGLQRDRRGGPLPFPVIILSARASVDDRVLGLELGAIDYVPKPFSPRELVLRVRAVLNRLGPNRDRLLEFGSLRIDPVEHRVTVDGVEVPLTRTEFRLLSLLAGNPARVFERDRLLDDIWGAEVYIGPRTVDTHMANLRGKLGAAGAMIQTVRGFGYRFEPQAAPRRSGA
jgi:two-component system phosphate regulon response regulator PhoB